MTSKVLTVFKNFCDFTSLQSVRFENAQQCVSSLLLAHQHILGYLVPCDGVVKGRRLPLDPPVTSLVAQGLLVRFRLVVLFFIVFVLVACPFQNMTLLSYDLFTLYTTQSYIHISTSTCIRPHATSHRLSLHTTVYMLAMQLSTAPPPASMSRGYWPFNYVAPPRGP